MCLIELIEDVRVGSLSLSSSQDGSAQSGLPELTAVPSAGKGKRQGGGTV